MTSLRQRLTVRIDVGIKEDGKAAATKATAGTTTTTPAEKWGPCRTCVGGAPAGGDGCGGGWAPDQDQAGRPSNPCGFNELGCQAKCVPDPTSLQAEAPQTTDEGEADVHTPAIVTQTIRLVVLANP